MPIPSLAVSFMEGHRLYLHVFTYCYKSSLNTILPFKNGKLKVRATVWREIRGVGGNTVCLTAWTRSRWASRQVNLQRLGVERVDDRPISTPIGPKF